jgi:hypothetical protein
MVWPLVGTFSITSSSEGTLFLKEGRPGAREREKKLSFLGTH